MVLPGKRVFLSSHPPSSLLQLIQALPGKIAMRVEPQRDLILLGCVHSLALPFINVPQPCACVGTRWVITAIAGSGQVSLQIAFRFIEFLPAENQRNASIVEQSRVGRRDRGSSVDGLLDERWIAMARKKIGNFVVFGN